MAANHENPSSTIFHAMNDYKTPIMDELSGNERACPLKAAGQRLLALYNTEYAGEAFDVGAGLVRINTPDNIPRVEYVGGMCDKGACAWYDCMAERCAVLSIARSIGRSK